MAKPQRLAREVFTCYEAGAFGFHLHRKLTEMGVTDSVVQPQDWDERGKGVKTDRTDALALCQRLDRFTRGNLKAHYGRGALFSLLSIVRVPTEDEERERSLRTRSVSGLLSLTKSAPWFRPELSTVSQSG